MARRVQKTGKPVKNRGVRKAPFVVLIGADMPSILTEISFLSNPADEQMLKKPEQRQKVAEGLYQGVASYLESMNSVTMNLPANPPPGAPRRQRLNNLGTKTSQLVSNRSRDAKALPHCRAAAGARLCAVLLCPTISASRAFWILPPTSPPPSSPPTSRPPPRHAATQPRPSS